MTISDQLKTMAFKPSIFFCMPQQVFHNRTVVGGAHNVEDVNYCEVMLDHFTGLLEKAEKGTHVSLCADLVEDKNDLRRFLINMYKTDILRYRSNLLNLIHSEN